MQRIEAKHEERSKKEQHMIEETRKVAGKSRPRMYKELERKYELK